jgi:hypothetical protein
MTDNYVDGPRNAAQKMDNLLIDKHRKPFTRPGSTPYLSANSQVDGSEERVNALVEFNKELWATSQDKLFYSDGSNWVEKQINSVGALDRVDSDLSSRPKLSTAKWQNHLLLSAYDDFNEQRVLPRKVYKNDIATLGLPSVDDIQIFFSCINNAKSLRNTINTHVSDATAHNSVLSTFDDADPVTIDDLFDFVYNMVQFYEAHRRDAELATPVDHPGSHGDKYQPKNLERYATFNEVADALDDLRVILGDHLGDLTAHNNVAGLVSVVNVVREGFFVNSMPAGTDSYLYALVFKRTYFIDDVFYIDRSPPEIRVAPAGGEPSPADNSFVNIRRTLGNDSFGTNETWGDDVVTIEIYRTEANGSILKFLAEIENKSGETNVLYSDETLDANLGFSLYTEGGVLDNVRPPESKFVIQSNDVVWYLNIKEWGLNYPYRIRHSVPLNPDACPDTFAVDLDGEITGGGVVGIYPIIFTEDKVYRLEGTVDALGRGTVKKRIIDETVGCISHNSIVDVKNGLYFAGTDGFYFTNGLKVTKISQHLNQSFRTIINRGDTTKLNIYGTYDPKFDLIYWGVASRDPDTDETENTDIWVHDPHWGLPNNEGTFTAWLNNSNMRPTALAVIDGDLYRADSRGYVFQHSVGETEDPIVDTAISPDTWSTRTVIFDYISCAFSFGSTFMRKWVTRLLTAFQAETAVSVQPYSINDDSASSRALKGIRNSTSWTWGDPFFVWGDPEFVWRVDPTEYVIRRFPRNTLRTKLKQVRYTAGRIVKTNSDADGSVTPNTTTKVITLDSGNWTAVPGFSALVGGYITFQNNPEDAVDSGFEILSATGATITVDDPTNSLPATSQATWLIVNFDLGEQFYLEGYTILYDVYGSSHTAYNAGDLGENVT